MRLPVGRGEADQVDAAAGGRVARARVRAAVRGAEGPQRQLRDTEDQRQFVVCRCRHRQLAQCAARCAAWEQVSPSDAGECDGTRGRGTPH